jgi:hypothetical protein
MLERTAVHNQRKTPNYMMRRVVAVGMLGLASFGVVKGTAEFVGGAVDRLSGTDIPNAQDVLDHPNQYADYVVKRGDTIEKIAKDNTTANHDFRNNEMQIEDQLRLLDPDYNGVLQPGDHIRVTTTQPPEDSQQNS